MKRKTIFNFKVIVTTTDGDTVSDQITVASFIEDDARVRAEHIGIDRLPKGKTAKTVDAILKSSETL